MTLVPAPRRQNNGAQNVVRANANRLARPPGQGLSRNARRRRNAGSNMQSIQAPATYGSLSVGGAPRFIGGPQPGVMRIAHHEVMTNVTGTTAFTSLAFGQNVGTRAWLGGVAQNFSRFRWVRFKATYVTTSSTTDRGDVSLGVIYDAIDALPQSMAEASALANSMTVPVWSSSQQGQCDLVVDCSRQSKPFYNFLSLDEGATMDPQDLDTFVPFWVLVSKQTSINGQLVGRVYVDYEIELSDPIPSRMNTTPSIAAVGLIRRTAEDPDPAPIPDPTRKMLDDVVQGLRLLSGVVKEELADDESEDEAEAMPHAPEPPASPADRT